jgi:hypothetical chaperone protein
VEHVTHGCGIDFGTSNSAVAIARRGENRATIVAAEPSCILIVDEGPSHRLYVGREALELYLATSRPSRFVKSIKSVLPDPSFTTTNVFGRAYAPEHLVRPILSSLRAAAEAAAGEAVTAVTLGRPVVFAPDPEADACAQRRLERAARLAGFERIAFRREPEAAGWSYARGLDRESRVLVADLGGGTADFTVLLLRPSARHETLAIGGARIGGDDFDGYIMRDKLLALFGRGSTYESWGKELEVPPHIYQALCRWDLIPFLKESQTRQDLKYILAGSNDPLKIERLIALIDGDLGYGLFREIAAAKHAVSEAQRAPIAFRRDGIRVAVDLARAELEAMIAADLQRLRAEALATLGRAGLAAADLDACFLTGGTSLVPAVGRLFAELAGPGRLRTGDTFNSVALGLALMAAAET